MYFINTSCSFLSRALTAFSTSAAFTVVRTRKTIAYALSCKIHFANHHLLMLKMRLYFGFSCLLHLHLMIANCWKYKTSRINGAAYACWAFFKPILLLSLPHKLYFKYLKTKSSCHNDNVHYSVCFAFYLCCLVFRQNGCIGQGSFQCFCIFLPRLILRTNVTIFLTKIKGELLNNGTSLIKTPKRQKCSICIRKVSIV